MTVAELIEELKKLPQDYFVLGEGCDCTNPVTGAGINTWGSPDEVLIRVNV